MWYVIQKSLHVLPSLTNLKKLVGAYPLANSRREPNILGLTMNWARSSGMSHLAQLIAQSQQRLSIVLPPARGRGWEEPLLQCNPGFWRQVIISNQQSGTSNFEDDESSRIIVARRSFAKDGHLRNIAIWELVRVALTEVVRNVLVILVKNSNILRDI